MEASGGDANPFGDDDTPTQAGGVDEGNPFGYSDNPFGEDSDEEVMVGENGNPFGDNEDEEDAVGNPFGDDAAGAASRARPVSLKKKSRALAIMRGFVRGQVELFARAGTVSSHVVAAAAGGW